MIGYALFLLPTIGGNYWTNFFPPIAALGLGMAITVAPLTTTVMSSVPQSRAGVASGVNNAIARTAGLIAIAVLGTVMLHVFQRELQRYLADPKFPPTVADSVRAQSAKLAAIDVPKEAGRAMQESIRRAIDESFVAGFRTIMVMGAVLALAGATTSLIFFRATKRARPG
jgi:hypothetical protein